MVSVCTGCNTSCFWSSIPPPYRDYLPMGNYTRSNHCKNRLIPTSGLSFLDTLHLHYLISDYKNIIGWALVVLGSGLLASMTLGSSVGLVVLYQLIIGAGVGFLHSTTVRARKVLFFSLFTYCLSARLRSLSWHPCRFQRMGRRLRLLYSCANFHR